MSFAFPAARFSSQRNIQRGAAIALLALIHVLAISLLLTSRQASAPLSRSVREIVISFPIFRPRPIRQKPQPSRTHTRVRHESLPSFTLPPGAIPPATHQELSGVGHALFGCDPATMTNPDQEAGCRALAAKPLPEEIGMPKTSHVAQTARWMHELEIKHSRRLVPCVGFFGPIFAVDLVCVAKGFANGLASRNECRFGSKRGISERFKLTFVGKLARRQSGGPMVRVSSIGVFAALMCAAQPATAATPPGGIYVIMNATSLGAERHQESTVGAALQNPGVDGVLIHLHWDEINPARGTFDWRALDRATVLAANKRFEIGIATGIALPRWVIDPPRAGLGAAHATFSYNAAMANGCNTMVLPAPYDAAYLNAFRKMLHGLANHLRQTGAYDRLSMLKLVGITTTTNELRLPSLAQCGGDAVKTWQSLGYTPAKVRGAWGEMLKAYLDNFPEKSFNIGYIGINAFPGIREDGSAADTPAQAAALSRTFNAVLIDDAAKAMPDRLALGFDSLTLNLPPQDSSYTQYLNAFFAVGAKVKLGWQTNELLQQKGGAACGGAMPRNAIPCASSDEFLAMLLLGLYPQGKDHTPRDRQGVYLELFPQNINAYPDAVRAAHNNLAPWSGTH